MEGVPRMPMLSVELKYSPSSTDFGEKLLEHIARAYQEDPGSYAKEVEELNTLRENSIKASADFTGCVLLKKYFAQLNLLKNRFPMETGEEAAVSFIWYEKYSDMPNPVAFDDIRYEMACVLHNVGAMHSYLGSLDSRVSSDGMKLACTHFQCAAWAFQHLRGNFNASTFCSDFDKNILTWHSNLMLAQAQECILEKSLIDRPVRKYNIIAKIAIQVAEFYKECVKSLEQPSVSDVVGGSRCNSWKKFVKMKEHYYTAVGNLYLGYQSEEIQKTAKEQKMGERLAYFQIAADHLVESQKLAQKESESVKETLQFANDVIMGKLTNAKKENDFIYHDKIPSLDTLPDVKGATLVKGIPFDPLDLEISGPDIFQRLVPLAVHRDSSLYSEEKATLLRSIVAKIEKRNEELKQHLDALQMDQLHLDEDFSRLPLPESLLERCAAFNARPNAVPELVASMQNLSTMYSEVDYAMTELENQLNDAEKDIKSDQETYGKNEECLALLTKLKEMRDEFDKYRDANSHATKSNTELHKAMAAHSDNLKVLSLPLSELKKQLPMPANPGGQTPEGMELKRILSKVEEMKNQREMLLDQLRKQMIADDLTKILLANREKDPKEIFEKSLKKYDEQINLLEQNLKAQDNILKALTESNAKYAKIRQQTSDVVKARDAKILSLVAAFDVSVDLNEKSKQGVEFYKKLQKTLTEFNEKMIKFGENLNDVENKLQSKAEKLSAAAAAATAKTATNYVPQIVDQSEGPKLKDYLAYYKAKKALSTNNLPTNFDPNQSLNYPQQFVQPAHQQQVQLPANPLQYPPATASQQQQYFSQIGYVPPQSQGQGYYSQHQQHQQPQHQQHQQPQPAYQQPQPTHQQPQPTHQQSQPAVHQQSYPVNQQYPAAAVSSPSTIQHQYQQPYTQQPAHQIQYQPPNTSQYQQPQQSYAPVSQPQSSYQPAHQSQPTTLPTHQPQSYPASVSQPAHQSQPTTLPTHQPQSYPASVSQPALQPQGSYTIQQQYPPAGLAQQPYSTQVGYAPQGQIFYSQPSQLPMLSGFAGSFVVQPNVIDAPVADRLPAPLQPTLIPTPIQNNL